MWRLADVFKKFRHNSIKNNGLSPSYYLSVPPLSWDAIFNMTKIGTRTYSRS